MIPYSRPIVLIYIPYPRVNCLKTIPFTAAHTYIAHIWQYPSPGGGGGVRAFRVPPLDPPLQMVYPMDVSDIILRYILQCLTLTLVH